MTDNPVAAAIHVTENLARVLEQENTLLRGHQAQQISPLVTEKTRLGQQMRQAMEALRRSRHVLDAASAQERERLSQAADSFHAALQENGRLLGALRKVAEGLVQAVAEEAMRQSTPLKNYGQGGRMAMRPMGPATLSLNQVV